MLLVSVNKWYWEWDKDNLLYLGVGVTAPHVYWFILCCFIFSRKVRSAEVQLQQVCMYFFFLKFLKKGFRVVGHLSAASKCINLIFFLSLLQKYACVMCVNEYNTWEWLYTLHLRTRAHIYTHMYRYSIDR